MRCTRRNAKLVIIATSALTTTRIIPAAGNSPEPYPRPNGQIALRSRPFSAVVATCRSTSGSEPLSHGRESGRLLSGPPRSRGRSAKHSLYLFIDELEKERVRVRESRSLSGESQHFRADVHINNTAIRAHGYGRPLSHGSCSCTKIENILVGAEIRAGDHSPDDRREPLVNLPQIDVRDHGRNWRGIVAKLRSRVHLISMAVPKQWLWQVMFGPHRMLTKRGDSGRQTVRHFEDEQAAREFARRMVQAGHTVRAGTKPGVEPAKKVHPAEVEAWCAEKD